MVLKILRDVEAAIFARVTPDQKGKLATIAKKELDMSTLAIGDGQNDEVMLQNADVGLKLVNGNPKMQLKSYDDLVPDVFLSDFAQIKRLLFLHGIEMSN